MYTFESCSCQFDLHRGYKKNCFENMNYVHRRRKSVVIGVNFCIRIYRMYDHSNESFCAVLSCTTVYNYVQGGSNFKSVDETLVCDHSNESY